MKNQWYCGVDGQQYGPFTWEQLRAMAAEGRIVTDSFVRRDVDQQWFQAAQVPGLLPKAHSAKRNGASSSSIGKAAARTSDSGAMAAVGGDPAKSATALKRPKKAASHSSGNIPVGQPVSAPPVSVTPPAGIPVGQPVVAPTAAPQFAFTTTPAVSKSTAASDPPEPAKKNNTLLIVGILGGACALVALIGVGAVVWSLTRAAKAVKEQIADADAELLESMEGLANDLQENPQALTADLQPIAAEAQKAIQESVGPADGGGAQPAAALASSAEAAKLLKSLSKWTDASQLRGIELNKLKLNLGSVWLASDENGTRVQPAADGSAGAKFVFVEVNVRNVAPVARSFTSWNATAGTSVVLADQNDAVLNLVPPSATPSANRLTTVELQPGQNVTDTLVFTAPGGKIDAFKLALAKSALAGGAKFRTGSHLALEIPAEMLMTRPGSAETAAQDPIAASIAPTPAGEQPAIIAEEPAAVPPAGNPPPTAAPAPAPKKENRPPTREELNKQFEELSKENGEAKKGEAQK